MNVHPSHDFPPITADDWRCRNCGCRPTSPDARVRCEPVTFDDDPRAGLPCDVEPGDG